MFRRYWAWGYKSRDAATEALHDAYASGEISDASDPQVSSYPTNCGRRWGITELTTC